MRNKLISQQWHLAVAIPARNEEDLLPACIRSVLRAGDALPSSATFDVVVCVDSSTDGTASIAHTMLRGKGVAIATAAGCVGHARSLAVQAALERRKLPLERCWIANTDADCEVPEDWLVKHLEHARSNVSAVTGIVDVQDFTGHDAAVQHRFRTSYSIHPDGTHPHIHGANLGVRADSYLLAGGWNPLRTAEDHDLLGRIYALGLPVRSHAGLVVVTSGRRIGRAPLGFAQALAAHNDPVIL